MEMNLKDNLRILLHARKIKAAELARRSGVSPSVISEWMSGRLPRNVANLQRIAKALDIPLGDLCFGSAEGREGPRKGGKITQKSKEILPLIFPINESGLLELQVRWTSLASEKKKN